MSTKFNVLKMQVKELKTGIIAKKPPNKSIYLPSGQYDINAIHDKIKDTLDDNKKRMEQIQKDISSLNVKLQLSTSNETTIQDKIFQLKREFRELEYNTTYHEFDYQSNILLEQYKKLNQLKQDSFFIDKKNKELDDNVNDIIEKYIQMAKKYIDIPPKKTKENEQFCPGCNQNNWDYSTEGSIRCFDCGLSMDVLDVIIPSGKSSKNINKNYSLDKHLMAAINQMECTQNKDISNSVYDKIRKEMEKKNINSSRLTKKDTQRIMQYIGYTEYEDMHKIHYEISGKPPIKLSQWTKDIMQDHMCFQRAYDTIKPPEKQNSQNKFYKLLRMCLRRPDFIPRKDDWCMIEEKIELYDDDTKIIYDMLGWEYAPINFNTFE